jgi:hypothetical protein
MIKTLAVAALVGSMMTVPTIAPVQAATMGANCLILPLLQADCRAAISEMVSATHAAAMDAKKGPRFAWWWAVDCTRAPAGAGHLYDCP